MKTLREYLATINPSKRIAIIIEEEDIELYYNSLDDYYANCTPCELNYYVIKAVPTVFGKRFYLATK